MRYAPFLLTFFVAAAVNAQSSVRWTGASPLTPGVPDSLVFDGPAFQMAVRTESGVPNLTFSGTNSGTIDRLEVVDRTTRAVRWSQTAVPSPVTGNLSITLPGPNDSAILDLRLFETRPVSADGFGFVSSGTDTVAFTETTRVQIVYTYGLWKTTPRSGPPANLEAALSGFVLRHAQTGAEIFYPIVTTALDSSLPGNTGRWDIQSVALIASKPGYVGQRVIEGMGAFDRGLGFYEIDVPAGQWTIRSRGNLSKLPSYYTATTAQVNEDVNHQIYGVWLQSGAGNLNYTVNQTGLVPLGIGSVAGLAGGVGDLDTASIPFTLSEAGNVEWAYGAYPFYDDIATGRINPAIVGNLGMFVTDAATGAVVASAASPATGTWMLNGSFYITPTTTVPSPRGDVTYGRAGVSLPAGSYILTVRTIVQRVFGPPGNPLAAPTGINGIYLSIGGFLNASPQIAQSVAAARITRDLDVIDAPELAWVVNGTRQDYRRSIARNMFVGESLQVGMTARAPLGRKDVMSAISKRDFVPVVDDPSPDVFESAVFPRGNALAAPVSSPGRSFTPPSAGTYTFRARAWNYDVLDRPWYPESSTASDPLTLTITVRNNNDPTLTVDPLPNCIILGQTLTFSGTAADPDDNLARLQVLSGASVIYDLNPVTNTSSQTLSFNYVPPAIGTYNFTVRATDTLGRTVERTMSVLVEPLNAPPVIAFTAPRAGANVTTTANYNDVVVISAAATDANLASLTITSDAGAVMATGLASASFSFRVTGPGTYRFTASALDTGYACTSQPPLVGQAFLTITVAPLPPTVTWTLPSAGTVNSDLQIEVAQFATVTIQATGADPDNNLANVNLILPDGRAIPGLPAAQAQVQFTSLGTYTATAQATDALGARSPSITLTIVVTEFNPPPVGPVTIAGVLVSGADTPNNAIGRVEQVRVVGGIIAMGNPTGRTDRTGLVELTADGQYLNGAIVPPVVPSIIDMRILDFSNSSTPR